MYVRQRFGPMCTNQETNISRACVDKFEITLHKRRVTCVLDGSDSKGFSKTMRTKRREEGVDNKDGLATTLDFKLSNILALALINEFATLLWEVIMLYALNKPSKSIPGLVFVAISVDVVKSIFTFIKLLFNIASSAKKVPAIRIINFGSLSVWLCW